MKQTLIKITDDHYVVVDDSEIKENDWVLDVYDNSIKLISSTIILPLDKDYWKKVTHSTNILINGMGILYISEVKELIGEVDVEKKAEYDWMLHTEGSIVVTDKNDWKSGFHHGYNQALEDNKDKKYTLEDMKCMFQCGRNYQNNAEITFKVSMEYLQPKTQWEVTFDEQGKLRLL